MNTNKSLSFFNFGSIKGTNFPLLSSIISTFPSFCLFLGASRLFCIRASEKLNNKHIDKNGNNLSNGENRNEFLLHKIIAAAMSIKNSVKPCSNALFSPWNYMNGYRINTSYLVPRSFDFYEKLNNEFIPSTKVEVNILKTPERFIEEKRRKAFLNNVKENEEKNEEENFYILKMNIQKYIQMNKTEDNQKNKFDVKYEDKEKDQIYEAKFEDGKIKYRNTKEDNKFESFLLSEYTTDETDFVCIEGRYDNGLFMGKTFFCTPKIYGGKKWCINFEENKTNFKNENNSTLSNSINVPSRPRKIIIGYIYGEDPLTDDSDVFKINANINAKVIKIDIKPGQTVTKGESLIVLEAMKMETIVRSPCDGKVENIFAQIGEYVNIQQTLAIICKTL